MNAPPMVEGNAKMEPQEGWLASKQARSVLHVSTCGLTHLREAGNIRFRKQGNAYLYSEEDCRQIAATGDSDDACSVQGSRRRTDRK